MMMEDDKTGASTDAPDTSPKPADRTFVQQIEVTGKELVEKVRTLAKEGSVRSLTIKADDGDVFLKTPLNIGLAVGGVVVLAAPWLAILGAIAALVTKVKIEVERDGPAQTPTKPDDPA
jgi:CO dehydrogenase/acetyl-CoA synthase beta subunit